ncbi:hypothetical protein [Caulobacter sp. S45]|uniref:hypothetical protein n=1 Tax=Caulobacter sp. S45 TaxID=1641861 RepID=UPI00131E5957|nr:hypothetical protein [Caulobacter sp. S45]
MAQQYTFFYLDKARTPATFDIEYFNDDTEALAHAEKLLVERPRYHAIEIDTGSASVVVQREA